MIAVVFRGFEMRLFRGLWLSRRVVTFAGRLKSESGPQGVSSRSQLSVTGRLRHDGGGSLKEFRNKVA